MADGVNEEADCGHSFTAYEIDLDYEFDAARFFDFGREELPLEAGEAEVWFDLAGSYPPSPFVTSLFQTEENIMKNISISPKSKGVESCNLAEIDYNVKVEQEISAMEIHQYGGQAIDSLMGNHISSENQTKSSTKPIYPRSSTLMKPTASHLAKQNRPFQAGYSRSNMHISKNSAHTCVIENQAAKRQKLEGGLLRKVVDTVHLQPANLAHKLPKQEGFHAGGMSQSKPRITIPRDPDLQTASRAQRTRVKCGKDENSNPTVRRFKALPLNRKILEPTFLTPKQITPRIPDFQEFHLKTSERAMQHSSAVLKSKVPQNNSNKDLHQHITSFTPECGNRGPERTNFINTPSMPESSQPSHRFKALPLNKKVLASKGDIGVFWNRKKETTVPMEFNFQTVKRFHSNPPIDLFNKLSLASETQPQANKQHEKGSKENVWGCFQQGNEMNQLAKFNLPLRQGKQ